jgi:hypothetical protein
MSAWFVRNIMAYHSLTPPGNGKLIWATGYDDIFYFFNELITPQHFFELGVGKIILDRLTALWGNVKGLLAVNGSIVLVPLIAMGIWRTRKNFITRLAVSIILLNLLVMSLIFPYAGYRGGFFHSNSAVQTVLWGLVPIGLSGFIDLGVKYRKWVPNRSWKMFGSAVIASLSILSVVIFLQKMNYASTTKIPWNDSLQEFQKIDQQIVTITSDEDSVILVNDPPGYYLATQRMAAVNPSDGVTALLAAADKYHARYTIIDENNAVLFDEISRDGFQNKRLKLIEKLDDMEIYEILH